MRTNFILVDLDNFQPKNMGLLHGRPFKFKTFLRANQGEVPPSVRESVKRCE